MIIFKVNWDDPKGPYYLVTFDDGSTRQIEAGYLASVEPGAVPLLNQLKIARMGESACLKNICKISNLFQMFSFVRNRTMLEESNMMSLNKKM